MAASTVEDRAPATPGLSASPARLDFRPLHHADRLQIVNPHGDVGLVALWSPLRTVTRRLRSISPSLLDPAQSRIAAIGNLYGDGLYAMLCNLLYNPQVRHLVALGEDLGLSSCAELEAFIECGLEDAEVLGTPVKRIVGTDRLLICDPAFDARQLRERLTFSRLGKLSSHELPGRLTDALDGLERADPPAGAERVRVEMPAWKGLDEGGGPRPSDATAHQVTRARPLDCWEELVVRTMRFGDRVPRGSGERIELLNVRTVIAEPHEESPRVLEAHGFSPSGLRAYQRRMFDAALPAGAPYTYGNRLGGHFSLPAGDGLTLAAAARLLREDPETRRAFISIWDNTTDLAAEPDSSGGPCLATIAFRHHRGRLALTATYRAHNLLIAWLENVYGLIAVQRHVAAEAGMEQGPITVISHSLGIDPANSAFPRAQALAAAWKRDDDFDRETGRYTLREDPNGYFVVGADRGERLIVAEHRSEGLLLKRYTGTRAKDLAHQISADMAVSLPSHALWLGTELARAEAELADT